MRDYSVMKQWLIEKVEETSSKKVGSLLGIKYPTIDKICSGEISRPGLDTLLKIEEAMGDTASEPTEKYSYVAVLADEEKRTITTKTNIDEAEKAITLLAVAMGDMAVDFNLPEAFFLGLVASTYRKSKKHDGVL